MVQNSSINFRIYQRIFSNIVNQNILRSAIVSVMREWTVLVYGQVLSCIAKIHFPGENHFKNVRQLTFGGVNTEAYFRWKYFMAGSQFQS
ncbi:hypothetical protein KIN20_033469 [Parelaphostrongylus tenuis]|uniref:Uncharacterized protein n=1 Tax=Parelaphostrongylus tenuis TaxID=148309 RepID=A0AAD5RAB9_PARTN|nr:hypothetical protein KIN20_033469 [Parelaphostrongylus tenuis]